MLLEILKNINNSSKYLELNRRINAGENLSCFGLNFSEISLFSASIKKPIIFAVSSIKEAYKYESQFKSLKLKTSVITNRIENYYYNEFNTDENFNSFLITMFNLVNNNLDVVIILNNVLTQRLISPKVFKNHIVNFKIGNSYNFNELISLLINAGYKRVSSLFSPGEFCVKGDVIDIFPVNESLPIRLDFFDEELENISFFSLENYNKLKSIKEYDLCPSTFIFYNEKDIEYAKKVLKSEIENAQSNKVKEKQKYILNDLENAHINTKTTYFLPFIKDNEYSIVDYLSESGVVIFNEPKLIIDNINNSYVNAISQITNLRELGELTKAHLEVLINKSSVFKFNRTKLAFLNLNTSNRIFESDYVFSFLSSFSKSYNKNFNNLKADIKSYLASNKKVVACVKNNSLAESFQKFLKENDIFASIITSPLQVKENDIYILVSNLAYGGIFPEDNLVLLGNIDIYGVVQEIKSESAEKTRVFTLPKIGDFVVHQTHGICKCLNIQNITFNGYSKDYIVLEFLGGDKLFLPTEKANMLSSYIGEAEPKLNKMGGLEFSKEKQKVKNKLKEIAFDLLSLYAKRQTSKGFKFCEDDYLQTEFESAFPYELTADQIKAINEIKADMTSGKVMDRLVFGDVGYGKTEVALVSAFKAILSGKQVAFLSPTTILSEQHYKTCLARMDNFMVNVKCLNRFKSNKEQKQILKDLKEGKINLICGTHRLLSKDVEFKDLGLLILDEEQRFGVEDKEKIKNLKENIAVLTLSATPIPRTLHLSMIGVRDISIIDTPPKNRMPVQTVVVEYSNGIIKQAIQRELERNGQVLIIYNRVESIYTYADSIRRMFPDVSLGVAHGQMPQKLLEDEIQKLYNEETKILVSTVLIENGVDLRNANTLIVVNADKLGLSQLYQLRGRVGRSDRNAYAYLTFEKNVELKEESYKRLSAMSEFSELGSGFKIAMRDLEIRGAGTVLGKEQHGHIEKVGYDMYVKLLKEAVSELKGKNEKVYADTKIDILLSCFVPNSYIDDENTRFNIYEQISNLSNVKAMEDLKKSLISNFKTLPVETENLMLVATLKNLINKLNVKRVLINNNDCYFELNTLEDAKSEIVLDFLSKNTSVSVLKEKILPIIEFKFMGLNTKQKLEKLVEIFDCFQKSIKI